MAAETARVTTLIDAPATKVWSALTDPDAIAEYYLGATVKTDWTVGHPITWSGEWKGKPYEDKGEILACEPERELSYSHWSAMSGAEDDPENYHRVTLHLDGTGEGQTRVTLTQSNLDGTVSEEDREHRDDYEQNWSTMLAGLKQVAER